MTHSDKLATPAIRHLKTHHIPYTLFSYRYEDKGGTTLAATALGIEEHRVIKTLVMENDSGNPLIILMHGDRQVSTKHLARHLQAKSVKPCDPQKVTRLTGYVVGGISPFGVRTPMPVYMESGIALLSEIYLNAGKRGWLVKIQTADVLNALKPALVQVGI
jgi:Cys-tRNA(Pro) deacylase